jgi:hypothetical protein
LPELEGELKDWDKDKVSDNVMMLDIERAVEKVSGLLIDFIDSLNEGCRYPGYCRTV